MQQPIMLQAIASAKEKQIPEQSLKSQLFAISSEFGFCAKDTSSDPPTLRIVNLKNTEMDTVLPMKAEAAIMAPNDAGIIVLRVPQALQAMSLATKANLGRHNFDIPQTFEYWTWLDNDRLAVVCPDAVYTWAYASDQYLKIMNRDPALTSGLNGAKINGFSISPDRDYAILSAVGLDPNTNTVQGNIQFYCFSKEASRVMPGHAGTLTQYKEDDVHPACTILTFANKAAGATELDMNMVECGAQKDQNGNSLSGFTKKQFKIPLNPAIAQQEFPLYIRSSSKLGFTYMVSKMGMFYVHDIGSGTPIYQVQASPRGVFTACSAQSGEIVLAAGDGTVSVLKIDENQIVDFIMTRLGKADQAFKLAMRANLRGADKLFTAQFENLFSTRQWREAALMVKKSPADTLRNESTLKRFIDAGDTIQVGEKPPVLIYLATILENDGSLQNEAESLELVRQFAAQGKIAAVETYVQSKKLFECEALGDVLLQNGLDKLAFKIYNQSQCHEKCIFYLIQQNQLESITKYAERFPDYKPDYAQIIQKGLGTGLGMSAEGIENLKLFANTTIATLDPSTQVDEICGIASAFKNFGYTKEATFLLLEVCKKLDFSESSGPYQTLIFVINLEGNPQFAEALFQKNKLTHFDRTIIYQKCENEKAKLYQRAFEFADNDEECMRIAIQYGNQEGKPIFESPVWYAEYCRACGRFDEQYYNGDVQACVTALFNFQQALLDVTVEGIRIYAPYVAAAFAKLPLIAVSTELISSAVEVFKAFGLDGSEALFSFLAAIFPSSIDPKIHEMYLTCAMQLANRENDIMLVARESHYINGDAAFKILVSTPTKSEQAVVTALLTICSRFKLSDLLVKFLCEAIIKREKQSQYFVTHAAAIMEQYFTNFAPEEAHLILKALFENGVLSSNDVGVLDSIFSIDFLARVIANQNVRDRCDIGLVVEICMNNVKTIKIVRAMLEQRLMSGATDSMTHTSFAKILIEMRAQECEKFLMDDPYYDAYQVCLFIISNDKRRKDSFIQTMALKAAVLGAFNPQNPTEIRNMKCAQFLIEFSFGCSMYREISTLLLKRGSAIMWEMSLIGDFKPINADFFTLVNTRTLQQHREMFCQAVAQNTTVQVEKLEEGVIAACISTFIKIQEDPKIAKCLMVLLERIILTQGSIHMKSSALHDLLVIAAVRARELQKVSQYVKMVELVYNPDTVAKVCVQVAHDQNMPQFYEDAFEVYRRFDKLTEGVKVLIQYMSLERAEKFAEVQNNSAVFVVLGGAMLEEAQKYIQQNQISQATVLIVKAGKYFIRARDAQFYRLLITTVLSFSKTYFSQYMNEVISTFNVLIDFLRQARTLMFMGSKWTEHVEVDSALMYCYVKLDKFEELESFLQLVNAAGSGVVPNKGDIQQIGDRAFAEKKYASAKLLYSKIQNWSKLAITLLRLKDFQNAVDAGRRAEDIPTWRQINAACLIANQVPQAKTAGLYLIILPDELPVVSEFYQKNVKIMELFDLLEAGIEHPQAKAYTNKEQNLYTHLALLYARYMFMLENVQQQNKLARFLKSNSDKISIPLVIKECKKNLLWTEVVYLYVLSNEYDQAVVEMMQHPYCCDHKQLLQICGQVSQPDLLVQLTEFYIKFYPQNLVEFLKVSRLGYFQADEMLENKRKDFLSVDPIAVLRLAKQYEIERMIRPYFELIIEDGLLDINNMLVDIYIRQKDDEALIELIKKTITFDTMSTLDRLMDKKQTPALRRCAVYLFSATKKFEDGISYAITNKFYDEASTCAAASEDGNKCEQLLRLICGDEFPDKKIRKEIFTVAVSRCGDRARPDVVLELAWRFNMIDFAMPYLIGQMRSMNERIQKLEARKEPEAKAEVKEDGFGEFQEGQPQKQEETWVGGGWQ